MKVIIIKLIIKPFDICIHCIIKTNAKNTSTKHFLHEMKYTCQIGNLIPSADNAFASKYICKYIAGLLYGQFMF